MFPDSLRDRARKWLEHARRARNPAIAQTLSNRAKLLSEAAIHAERALGMTDEFKDPSMRVIRSNAETLQQLRLDLEYLAAGMSLHLESKRYSVLFSSPDQTDDAWVASAGLAKEFGCVAEFRPDGHVWFVKSARTIAGNGGTAL
jgi:hypothetical protein